MQKKNPFCFIHIEKAGGSTIHNWLKYYIPSYVSLHPWFYWSNEKDNYFTEKELKSLVRFHPVLSGFGGHTTRHFLDYERILGSKVQYITFLREPISRYLSNFQYQKNQMGIDWTLDSYLAEKRFNNFMTVRLAGEENVEKAIAEVNNCFDFVGLVEHFNESILLLTDILGSKNLHPYYEKINEGNRERKIIFEELDPELQMRIIENNALDIKLYEEVKMNIYPKQKINYGGDLHSELKNLENKLPDFKYNKIRRNLVRYFKGYNHFISEPIAHNFR